MLRRTNSAAWKSVPGVLVATLVASLLAACASTRGFPDRTEDVGDRLESLKANYFLPSANVVEIFHGLPANEKRAYRDKVVYARMMAIDLQFATFKEAIYQDGIVSNLSLEILGVAVGAAGAVTTGADTSRILSALSGGISGSRTAINKNLYYERTMPALLALMDAEREKIKVQIEEGLQQEFDVYPLGKALVDLERYFEVGSIPGAIASVTATAGKTKQQAEEDLSVVRKAAFVDPAAQERVATLFDLVDDLPAGNAWKILQKPPSPLDENTKKRIKAQLDGTPLDKAAGKLGGAANDANAKIILKRVLKTLDDRSKANLDKWKAAIEALGG